MLPSFFCIVSRQGKKKKKETTRQNFWFLWLKARKGKNKKACTLNLEFVCGTIWKGRRKEEIFKDLKFVKKLHLNTKQVLVRFCKLS